MRDTWSPPECPGFFKNRGHRWLRCSDGRRVEPAETAQRKCPRPAAYGRFVLGGALGVAALPGRFDSVKILGVGRGDIDLRAGLWYAKFKLRE